MSAELKENVENFLANYNRPKEAEICNNPIDYWKNSECKYFLEEAVQLLEKIAKEK